MAVSQQDRAARRKKSLGQFFTAEACWLQPQVVSFIATSGDRELYDPFAGTGLLLDAVRDVVSGFDACVGLDIDPRLGWPVNDSLVAIPPRADAIAVTNPPFLSSYSAARKGLGGSVRRHFGGSPHSDLYMIALDRLLDAQPHVVALVPESFVNSAYPRKARLASLTVLQGNPFHDTTVPVAVACFDARDKPLSQIDVFVDARRVGSLQSIEDARIRPAHDVPMTFNEPSGWLAVRCVDATDPARPIRFGLRRDFSYNWGAGIKNSSRLMTLIAVDVPEGRRPHVVADCNAILKGLRANAHDLVLSPFKGNAKNGQRRRRLDYATCRAIVETAIHRLQHP